MYLRSERIVSPQGIIKGILNIEDGKIIDIINYHARVMIDIDVADNLVISDISNAKVDINKATNVDNYLLNIDESQCNLMSFCQFLKTNESYFLADCNKLSKEVLELIINEKKDSAMHLVNSCDCYDSYTLVNSIKYFTQQLDVSLSDSLKMCC